MNRMSLIPSCEFTRVCQGIADQAARLSLIADMCRLNTLVEIKKAGSGHLGSSLSSMDLNVWLYYQELNVRQLGVDHPDRDVFFSSKGHDVPGLYAVLHSLGLLSTEKLLHLRRLHGLDGHPDVKIPGCEANTGSLGMGVGKGRGMAWAKRKLGRGGRVFVMTGDGELQEGQIWESLQTTAHHKVDLTVIVDHNKLQTDMPVSEVISLGDLERKFQAFGWQVFRCNGHDFNALQQVFGALAAHAGPKVLIADTIKGRGISFMERIADLPTAQGKYLWHSGAPADPAFEDAFDELFQRINQRLEVIGLPPIEVEAIPCEDVPKVSVTRQYVAAAYGEELVRLAVDHPEIVVLDGDLAADCKIREFAARFADRFIENGIAEQDMVSMAGGLARQGLLPVCNSFSSFLCARANEQIYNNACEGTKILYAAHFAGMIPAGPGKSHQSIRDIALLGSLPNLVIVQPCNLEEARLATRWSVESAKENVCLRMNIGPSPSEIALPANYRLIVGRGCCVSDGHDALIIAYGPVMLHEALQASRLAAKTGFSLAVVNQPWLNRFDIDWIRSLVANYSHVYTLDDHMIAGGMGDRLIAALVEAGMPDKTHITRLGLSELPACGTPIEVLKYHRLDGRSLAERILNAQGRTTGEFAEGAVFNTLEAAQ